MMRLLSLLSLLTLLVACASIGSPTETEEDTARISAEEVRGTWLFTRPGAASCLPSLRLELRQALPGAGQGPLSVSGEWSRPSAPEARAFSGTVDPLTGRFQLLLDTEPRTELQGTMRPNGTANGDYSAPGCTQKLNGRRQ